MILRLDSGHHLNLDSSTQENLRLLLPSQYSNPSSRTLFHPHHNTDDTTELRHRPRRSIFSRDLRIVKVQYGTCTESYVFLHVRFPTPWLILTVPPLPQKNTVANPIARPGVSHDTACRPLDTCSRPCNHVFLEYSIVSIHNILPRIESFLLQLYMRISCKACMLAT